jgi:hypothetical protein
MTSRILLVAATLSAALLIHGPADAAKKRGGIVLDKQFRGCAVWAPPACVKVGEYNVTGSGIVVGTYVSGFGTPQGVSYCGTPLKVKHFKVERTCWPWWPWPSR